MSPREPSPDAALAVVGQTQQLAHQHTASIGRCSRRSGLAHEAASCTDLAEPLQQASVIFDMQASYLKILSLVRRLDPDRHEPAFETFRVRIDQRGYSSVPGHSDDGTLWTARAEFGGYTRDGYARAILDETVAGATATTLPDAVDALINVLATKVAERVRKAVARVQADMAVLDDVEGPAARERFRQ